MNAAAASAGLVERALRAAKWSALGEVVSRSLSPLFLLVLVRYLSPADYGVVNACASVIAIAAIFWDAGLSQALIQSPDTEISASANAVFWSNLGLSALAYVVVAALAPSLEAMFEQPGLATVLRVQGLAIVASAFSAVQAALLRRNLEFRRLFWVRLVTTAAPGLVALPLAMNGYGYWALVAGNVGGLALQGAVLWGMSSWRPSFSTDLRAHGALFRFGAWVILESVLSWALLWADAVIVGAKLSTAALGLYRSGASASALTFGILLSPIVPVAYSFFSKLSAAPADAGRVLLTVSKLILGISLPVGLGLLLLGDVFGAAFGAKWHGVGEVIGAFGLMYGVSWYWGINTVVFKALGRPQVSTVVLLVHVCYYVPAYFIAVRFGLTVFLWTRVALEIGAFCIHAVAMQRVLGIGPREYVTNALGVVFASIVGAAVLFGTRWLVPGYPGALLAASLAVATYLAVLIRTEPQFIRSLLALRRGAAIADVTGSPA